MNWPTATGPHDAIPTPPRLMSTVRASIGRPPDSGTIVTRQKKITRSYLLFSIMDPPPRGATRTVRHGEL